MVRHLYKSSAIWLLLLVTVAPVLAANADGHIKIISSSETKPYQQVIHSFKTSIRQTHSNIEFSHKQEDTEKVAVPPNMVFALGSHAVREAIDENAERDLLATIIISDKVLQKATQATAILLNNPIHKQLEWHQRILPKSRRIGILFDPEHNQDWIDAATKIAAGMGLKIIAIPLSSAKELPSAFKLLGRKADSLLGIADKTVYSSKTAKSVLLFSFRNRIPFVGLSSAWVKAGALYALDWDYPGLGQQSASMALKMLEGAKAGEIEMQYPDKTLYLLNLKTAKHMKLKLNQDLIDGAARVYQ